MADFQAKICEKFNIKSLTDNQSKSITAIIDGKDVFVGLAKGYDPLYSSSPLASLDGFSRSHGDSLYVMQLVVAATNPNALYTSCLPCDLENPSNDAKGEDE
jgi:hypothetical protein